MPENSPTHHQYLPDVYRYAFLMTGSAATAAEVLRNVVENASRGLGDDDRKPGRAKRWLFAKARELCRHPQLLRRQTPAAPVPADPAAPPSAAAIAPSSDDMPLPTVPAVDDAANAPNRLAALFAVLPEKERSALVLFYLYLFNSAELAEILDIKPAELGALLSDARSLLQQHKVQCASVLAQAFATPSTPTPG